MLEIMKKKDWATLMGTLCGFCAIIFALSYEAYRAALFFILLSNIFDLLDGWIARLTKEFNEFGIQLDSLSDGIVFGIIPALVAYLIYTEPMTDHGIPGYQDYQVLFMAIPAFCLVASGIIRLAYFNISKATDAYSGLPIPVSASMLCIFILTDYFASLLKPTLTIFNQFMHYFIPILMVFLAWCNISGLLRYGKKVRKKSGIVVYIIFTLAAVMLILAGLTLFSREQFAIVLFIAFCILWVPMIWFLIIGFYQGAQARHTRKESATQPS